MSGILRRFLHRNTPTVWHFNISSSLSSRLLEENLLYLRGMKFKKNSVLAVSVSASQKWQDAGRTFTLHDAIKSTGSKLKVPLVTFAEDHALGYSYLLLSMGDTVYANPFSIIGSLGSRIQYISFEKLFQRLGIKYDVYSSGQPSFLPSRKPTENDVRLAEQSNKQVLQSIQDLVLTHRLKAFQSKGYSAERARTELLSGQTFTAEQAVQNGLVDKIGTFIELKNSDYRHHIVRTPLKYPGHLSLFPKMNYEIMVLADLVAKLETAITEVAYAQNNITPQTTSSTSTQTFISNAEASLAEFFQQKLKEPEFLCEFERYLSNSFYDEDDLVRRKSELVEMLQ